MPPGGRRQPPVAYYGDNSPISTYLLLPAREAKFYESTSGADRGTTQLTAASACDNIRTTPLIIRPNTPTLRRQYADFRDPPPRQASTIAKQLTTKSRRHRCGTKSVSLRSPPIASRLSSPPPYRNGTSTARRVVGEYRATILLPPGLLRFNQRLSFKHAATQPK